MDSPTPTPPPAALPVRRPTIDRDRLRVLLEGLLELPAAILGLERWTAINQGATLLLGASPSAELARVAAALWRLPDDELAALLNASLDELYAAAGGGILDRPADPGRSAELAAVLDHVAAAVRGR